MAAVRRLAFWRNLVLSALVTGLFLWLTLRGIDWDTTGDVFQGIRWVYLLPALGIWSVGLGVRAVRWQALLGGRARLWPAFHILNIGFLVNGTLPLRIGDLARAYLIARDEDSEVSGWAALSTVVTERIVDMLAVVLLLALVLPALALDSRVTMSGFALGAAALGGFVALLVFAHRPAWAHSLLTFALRLLPVLKRLNPGAVLDRILDGLRPLTTRRGLSSTALWTAFGWALSVAGAWALSMAFPEMPQAPVMRAALTLGIVTASFSMIVPFTIANVGPMEAAIVFAVGTAGVSPETALAYAVVIHFATTLTYLVWGGVGMLALGLSLGQVRAGAAAFATEGQT